MTAVVRTRFAPSPTGYMHIGGMRTALFCWLWARHNRGTFILRIDDTDQQRNVTEALGPIFRAFQWLGLDWDEGPDPAEPSRSIGPNGPYYQSQRQPLYRQAIEQLLASGAAYRDFDTAEVIAEDRKRAEELKQPYVTIRRSLNLAPEQIAAFVTEGKPHVVRLKVPREQTVAIEDAVRGHVEWNCGLMPDPVLMRSDGSFLYNFATVVDDAALQITHIIRAEEHLTNTAVQALLHDALGNPRPIFAHIPFITAPGSTKKLSKRDLDKLRNSPALKKMFDRADEIFPQLGLGDSQSLNPVMVEYYERLGYIPPGILNALSRLGWSLDDKTELMSLETIIANFSLDRIVKAPAGFDVEKLQSYQAHWMGQLTPREKLAGCWPFLVKAGRAQQLAARFPGVAGFEGPTCPQAAEAYVEAVLAAIGDRLRVFSDVLDHSEFFSDPLVAPVYDEKAFQQRIATVPEAVGLLEQFRTELAETTDFSAAALDRLVHEFVARTGIKINQLIQPLRIALTGKAVGVSLFDTLALLGRDGCAARLTAAIARAR